MESWLDEAAEVASSWYSGGNHCAEKPQPHGTVQPSGEAEEVWVDKKQAMLQ